MDRNEKRGQAYAADWHWCAHSVVDKILRVHGLRRAGAHEAAWQCEVKDAIPGGALTVWVVERRN
jgi:hypothetical protein